MLILLTALMIGPMPTNLANMQGKWTVGLGMKSFIIPNSYSILWRPFKTVAVGIEGGGYLNKGESLDYERWSGSVSIGLYKYFRASSSFSPFIALSPHFSMSYSYYGGENWREYSHQTYGVSLNPGVECFFGLMGKQLSLKFKTSLVSASHSYSKSRDFDRGTYSSDINDNVHFYLPTEGSLSIWLCFHF